MVVERHEIFVGTVARDTYAEARADVDEWRAKARFGTSLLGMMLSSIEQIVGFGAALDASADDLRAAIRAGAQAAAAIFAREMATEREMFALGDVLVPLRPSDERSEDAHVRTWINGFYYGLIAREGGALDVLARFDPERLRGGPVQTEEFRYRWAEALGSFWRGSEDVGRRLKAAVVATRPDAVGSTPMAVVKPHGTLMYALRAILDGDDAAFNKALRISLEAHRALFDNKRDRSHWTGFVALGALALACAATDRGLTVEVQSPYIPRELIDR